MYRLFKKSFYRDPYTGSSEILIWAQTATTRNQPKGVSADRNRAAVTAALPAAN